MFPDEWFPDMEKNLKELEQITGVGLANVVNKTLNGVATIKDTFHAGKVLDYYQMAQRAQSIYSDKQLFDYLQQQSQISYDSMSNPKVKDFVKKQVDDFIV